MVKLYVNENFPFRVVEILRLYGYDVLTSFEAGNANQRIPDDEVLLFSTTQKRILLTLNRRDFIKLHAQNDTHAGIIVCTTDSDFEALSERIHLLLSSPNAIWENQLLRINRGN